MEDGLGILFDSKGGKLMTLLMIISDFTMMTKDCEEKLKTEIKDSDGKSIMEIDTIQTKTKSKIP